MTSFPDVVERTLPCTVSIAAYKTFYPRRGPLDRLLGIKPRQHQKPRQQQVGGGSGVILTANGYILTNAHVVRNKDTIKVHLYDGCAFNATVVGMNVEADVAVIKIEADMQLTPVTMADSDALRHGEDVFAVGNPRGEAFSVSRGIISHPYRKEMGNDENPTTLPTIQHDAAINSGNSGGGLFNTNGELIGINTYMMTTGLAMGSIGIGYAIKANETNYIVGQIFVEAGIDL